MSEKNIDMNSSLKQDNIDTNPGIRESKTHDNIEINPGLRPYRGLERGGTSLPGVLKGAEAPSKGLERGRVAPFQILIAHIADIHIREEIHEEYQTVLNNLYESLRDKKPHIIAVVGDVFHNKKHATPVEISDVKDFLRNLQLIAPTVLIPGNHDTAVNKPGSLDLIGPVIKDANNLQNLHYFRETGIYKISGFDKINFIINAPDGPIFPREHPLTFAAPQSEKEIERKSGELYIALVHEEIAGVNSFGYSLSGRRFDNTIVRKEEFANFDLTLLGHIHMQQFLTERMAYPGSPIQQNFGEPHNGHGYLLWSATYPQNNELSIIAHEKIAIYNPQGYVKFKFQGNKDITEMPIPINIKGATIDYSDCTPEFINEQLESLQRKYNIKNIICKDAQLNCEQNKNVNSIIKINEDINDNVIQENLIREFLKDKEIKKIKITDKIIEEIINLHKQKTINSNKKLYIKSRWRLKKIKFNNMFCYGPNNFVDFTKFEHSISGIIAKNAFGKTSFIDIITYVLFGDINKHLKRENIINNTYINNMGKKPTSFNVELELEINGVPAIIKKQSDARNITVSFTLDGKDLTGIDASETYKNIAKYIGTYNNAKQTGFVLQDTYDDFIRSSIIRRKEISAELFNLGIFREIIDDIGDKKKICSIRVEQIDKQYSYLLKQLNQNNLDMLLKSKQQLNEEILENREMIFEIQKELKILNSIYRCTDEIEPTEIIEVSDDEILEYKSLESDINISGNKTVDDKIIPIVKPNEPKPEKQNTNPNTDLLNKLKIYNKNFIDNKLTKKFTKEEIIKLLNKIGIKSNSDELYYRTICELNQNEKQDYMQEEVITDEELKELSILQSRNLSNIKVESNIKPNPKLLSKLVSICNTDLINPTNTIITKNEIIKLLSSININSDPDSLYYKDICDYKKENGNFIISNKYEIITEDELKELSSLQSKNLSDVKVESTIKPNKELLSKLISYNGEPISKLKITKEKMIEMLKKLNITSDPDILYYKEICDYKEYSEYIENNQDIIIITKEELKELSILQSKNLYNIKVESTIKPNPKLLSKLISIYNTNLINPTNTIITKNEIIKLLSSININSDPDSLYYKDICDYKKEDENFIISNQYETITEDELKELSSLQSRNLSNIKVESNIKSNKELLSKLISYNGEPISKPKITKEKMIEMLKKLNITSDPDTLYYKEICDYKDYDEKKHKELLNNKIDIVNHNKIIECLNNFTEDNLLSLNTNELIKKYKILKNKIVIPFNINDLNLVDHCPGCANTRNKFADIQHKNQVDEILKEIDNIRIKYQNEIRENDLLISMNKKFITKMLIDYQHGLSAELKIAQLAEEYKLYLRLQELKIKNEKAINYKKFVVKKLLEYQYNLIEELKTAQTAEDYTLYLRFKELELKNEKTNNYKKYIAKALIDYQHCLAVELKTAQAAEYYKLYLRFKELELKNEKANNYKKYIAKVLLSYQYNLVEELKTAQAADDYKLYLRFKELELKNKNSINFKKYIANALISYQCDMIEELKNAQLYQDWIDYDTYIKFENSQNLYLSEKIKRLKYLQNKIAIRAKILEDNLHDCNSKLISDEKSLQIIIEEEKHKNEILININNLSSEMDKLNKEIYLYDVYSIVLNESNGIPNLLLKRNNETLQNQINQILASYTDMQIILIDDYNIKVKKSPTDIQRVESCSGYQKFILSMAYRIAVSKFSNAPLFDGIIIDEGLSTTDSENIQHVLDFLNNLSHELYTTMIITHNIIFQDHIDRPLIIKKFGDYSQITDINDKLLNNDKKSDDKPKEELENNNDKKPEDKSKQESKNNNDKKSENKPKQESDIITCDICKVSVLKKSWKGHIISANHLKKCK
jgi:DNA repair exonuclease SbcCD ATPase subunit/DNA repair exonuclease SbcCD nuclease subunit